ncbi:hypothetical protein CPC08DRAFT_663505 [Agrocybe pediades]|nr:hypothetical protein CPC08DRAFT_663505 [Agrocybe pediades]
MVNFTILAGGFSTFVASYVFDADSSTLSLTNKHDVGVNNPSWIAQHPNDSSIIYAVSEVTPGNISSLSYDSNNDNLTLVDTVPTGGDGPTFCNFLSTGEVSAMNFGSASATFVPTVENSPDHLQRGQNSVVQFNLTQGAVSNPHMSLEYNGEVFIPDLGADKIWRLVKDGSGFRISGQIDVDPGTGPRHIAIRDNILFTIHEKSSTLTAQHIPGFPNATTLPLIANVSIVPPEPSGFNASFAAAEILISEPTDRFPFPLIYVSNRNLGPDLDPRGDTIAIYEFRNSSITAGSTSTPADDANSSTTAESTTARRRQHSRDFHARQDDGSEQPAVTVINSVTGELVLQNQVFTGLNQIRSMALGKVSDGGDEFLVAGGNTDGGVVVLQRTDGGRNLTAVARNEEVPQRTSFVFV